MHLAGIEFANQLAIVQRTADRNRSEFTVDAEAQLIGRPQAFANFARRSRSVPGWKTNQSRRCRSLFCLYLASGILSMLKWWLDHKMPYPPERMDQIFHELVMPGFRSILESTGQPAAGNLPEKSATIAKR